MLRTMWSCFWLPHRTRKPRAFSLTRGGRLESAPALVGVNVEQVGGECGAHGDNASGAESIRLAVLLL